MGAAKGFGFQALVAAEVTTGQQWSAVEVQADFVAGSTTADPGLRRIATAGRYL